MKRMSFTIVAIAIFAMLLAACAAPAAAPSAPAAAPATSGEAAAGAPTVNDAGYRTDLAGTTIKYIGDSMGASFEFEKKLAAEFEEQTGIKVEMIEGAQSATERLAQYLQQLGAQSSDVDVYRIDVIWPGILAPHAVDLSAALAQQNANYFERIVANNTVDGKLVGIPIYVGAGLLYYRTDLLEKYGYDGPPETWAELEEMAKTIQEGERAAGNPDFWGYVWQGAAYEGLTCDALEWQYSSNGGTIVEPDGTISINNPAAAASLDRARTWIGDISPEGITTYKEEEARGVWQAGNAAFMRNWGYAWALGQAEDSVIKDKFAVSVLPKGDGPDGQPAATLGGWQAMVSTYSQNQEAAIEWARFITSEDAQTRRAIEVSQEPTIASVYENPDVIAANPYYANLLPVYEQGAVARPSTVTAELYNDVSTTYFTAVHQVLTGVTDGATAVADIERELQRILQ